MRPRTRLDPVIKIEEKNEERKLHEMAAANRKVKSAEEALLGARDAARTDHRRSAPATDWLLAEIAHTRALSDVRNAERAVKSATARGGRVARRLHRRPTPRPRRCAAWRRRASTRS